MIPAGRYTAEAWLPDELSGDRSESHFEIPARDERQHVFTLARVVPPS